MKSDKYFIVLMVSLIGIVLCAFTADARNRTFEQRRRYNQLMNEQINAQSNAEDQGPDDYSQEDQSHDEKIPKDQGDR